MVIGDKSKAQLSRAVGPHLALTFNQIGRDIPTFADAAGVADLIFKSGVEWDSVNIVYNKFMSAISYEAAVVEVLGKEALKESRVLLSNLFPSSRLSADGYSWIQGI
jgi:F-type H+-transporting ATPase subunit gamma